MFAPWGIAADGSLGQSRAALAVVLLVTLDPGVGLFALSRLRGEAERILGVDVDVVPEDSLKPDVRESVLADAVSL